MKKPPDIVVVIGAGPAASVRAEDIDCHTVVRLWNHDWQPAERYGTRYDYGVITNTQYALDASRLPSKAWIFYNVAGQNVVKEIGETPVMTVDKVRWFTRAEAMGARSADGRGLKFTRGFAAVAGAIDCLRPRRIVVIGMNILRDGVTGPKYYDKAALPFYVKAYPAMAHLLPQWAADEMPIGLRGEGPHDYTAESKLIRQLAAEAGVELVWESET